MSTIGTYTPDNLLAGDFPRITAWLTIPSGVLKRGTVVESDGAVMETGGDPFGVLSEDVDASGGPVEAVVYLSGEFARRHLILADNAAVSDTDFANLRKLSIFAKHTVPAV